MPDDKYIPSQKEIAEMGRAVLRSTSAYLAYLGENDNLRDIDQWFYKEMRLLLANRRRQWKNPR